MKKSLPRPFRAKKTTGRRALSVLKSAPKSASKSVSKRKLPLAIAAVSQILLAGQVYATPKGGVVVGGEGAIVQAERATTVNQTTDLLAIDWQSFDLAADERVTFNQPHTEAIALNRILGNRGSEIHGRIDANGHVILVNPNGVFFSETATINVGGLLASGLTIRSDDFMNGDFAFSALEGTEGTVIHSGIITAATGGSVTLLGQRVENNGMISANLGAVNLASGKEAVVTFDHEGLMGVRVTEGVLQEHIGLDPAVLNAGDISAEGGRILLSASASADIFSRAVNSGDLHQEVSVVMHNDGSFTLGAGADVVNTGNVTVSSNIGDAGRVIMLGENITSTGAVRADSAQGNGGEIELHATQDTVLSASAVLSAQSTEGGQGGVVKLLGERVGLFDSAEVNVSGNLGGGTALIGGDYQGANARIRNASQTMVGSGASIASNALSLGDAGRIILWSDGTTGFYGNLSAAAYGAAGDGGFVEVSGKENLDFWGDVSLQSYAGQDGSLLLDPIHIIIGSNGANDSELNNRWIDEYDGERFFYLSNTAINSALLSGNVTLEARHNIWLRAGFNIFANTGSSFTMRAGDEIQLDSDITLNTGSITLIAGWNCDCTTGMNDYVLYPMSYYLSARTSALVLNGDLYTSGGNITVRADEGSSPILIAGAEGNRQRIIDTGATGGNITLESNLVNAEYAIWQNGEYINFSGRNSLTLTGGTGNINISRGVGRNVDGYNVDEYLDSFTVTSATNLTIGNNIYTGSALNIADDASISLTATTINLNGSLYTNQVDNAGDIHLTGAVNLLGSRVINADSSVGATPTDGAVTITGPIQGNGNGRSVAITGGSITTGAIDTSGGSHGHGGQVDLTSTTGAIATGAISTFGGDTNPRNNGRNGGGVTIHATGGGVSVSGAILAYGSVAEDNSNRGDGFDGGIGGGVNITTHSDAANISVQLIDTSGGNGHALDDGSNRDTGSGGNAGLIRLQANSGAADIYIGGNLYARGGALFDADVDVGSDIGNGGADRNGRGGPISLIGNTVLAANSIMDSSVRNELAYSATAITPGDITFGGTLQGSTIDAGLENLTLNGANTIFGGHIGTGLGDLIIASTGNIDATGFTITAASFNASSLGGPSSSYISSHITTTGADNTAGGNVTINMGAGVLTVGDITTSGGTRIADGAGMNGGAVDLDAADITLGGINTSGGDAMGSNSGGDAGAVSVEAQNDTGTPTLTLNGYMNTAGGAGDAGAGAAQTAQFSIQGTGAGTLTLSPTAADWSAYTSDFEVSGSSGADTLIGPGIEGMAHYWATTTTSNTGTLKDSDSAPIRTITFSAFETLTGGDQADYFSLNHDIGLTAVNGGEGDDTFNINADVIAGAIAGDAGNDIFNLSTAFITSTLQGGTGADIFNILVASIVATVQGGEEASDDANSGVLDSIVAHEDSLNTWVINNLEAGSVDDSNDGSAISFTQIEQLDGSEANNDTFSFTSNAHLASILRINAGENADLDRDTLDLSGISGELNVILAVDGAVNGIAELERVTGNYNGGSVNTSSLRVNSSTGQTVTWSIPAGQTNDGSITAGSHTTSFTDFNMLNGGAGNDGFTVASVFNGNISGDAGNDTFTINAVINGNLYGGEGDDTFTLNQNVADTLDDTDVYGNEGNDTFNVAGNITAEIHGGDPSAPTTTPNVDTLNVTDTTGSYSWVLSRDIAGPGTGDTGILNSTIEFLDIEHINGADGADDSQGIDTFIFTSDFVYNGVINARGGADIVSIASASNVNVTLGNDINGVQSARTVLGGGNNATLTVIGGTSNTVATTWNISDFDGAGDADGENDGVISSETRSTRFINFGRIVGDNNNDQFTLADGASIVSIDGGSSTDTPADTNTLIVSDSGANSWTLNTTANTGGVTLVGTVAGAVNTSFADIQTIEGSGNDSLTAPDNLTNTWRITAANNAGTVHSMGFSRMSQLIGGSAIDNFLFNADFTGTVLGMNGDDRFDFNSGVIIGAVHGGDGTGTDNGTNGDTLIGLDASNTWVIDGATGNTLNTRSFSEIEHLTGGSLDDAFTFQNGGTVSGLVDGAGTRDGDTFIVTNTGAQTIELGSATNTNINVINIETVTSNNHAGTILTVASGNNTWNITDENDGNITSAGDGESIDAAFTGTVNFINFQNLTGGNNNDHFVIQANGNVENIVGGEGDTDTLTGKNIATIWNITGINSGNVTDTAEPTANTYVSSFNGIESLIGNNNIDDTFAFSGAGSIVNITAGTGGTDTANYSLLAGPINVTVGTATVNGLTDIERVVGNNTNSTITVNSDDGVSTIAWNITEENTGDVTLAGSTTIFEDFNHLIGAEDANTFSMAVAGSITGSIRGTSVAERSDTLRVLSNSDDSVAWAITDEGEGSVANTAPSPLTRANFSEMEILIGGAGKDTFTLGGDITGSIQGGANADSFIINTAFTGNILGGAGNDTFTIGTAGTAANIQGGDNSDTILGRTSGSSSWTMSGEREGSVAVTGGSDYIASYQTVEIIEGRSSATDTLTAHSQANTWTITSGDSTLGATALTTFRGMNVLSGGAGTFVDTFNITGGFTGTINGDAGDDQFNIGSAFVGRINGEGGDDRFTLQTGGSVVGNLWGDGTVGAGGTDGAGNTLVSNIATDTTWNITGVNTGELRNTGDNSLFVSSFNGVQRIVGTDSNADIINFRNANASIARANAGEANGIVDTATYEDVTAAISFTIAAQTDIDGVSNIEQVVGNSGAGYSATLIVNSLTGTQVDWTIGNSIAPDTPPTGFDGVNDGHVSGVNFIDFNIITGGAGGDTFNITGTAGAITGSINGGSGDSDSIVMQREREVTWEVDGIGEGNFTNGIGATTTTDFSGIENIAGHNDYVDLFSITSGTASINVDGGDPEPAIDNEPIDIVDFSSLFSNVSITVGDATTGGIGITDIEQINVGNGTNSITGANEVNTWAIDDVNAGSVTSASGNVTHFDGFQTIIGGNNNDTFTFGGSGSISALVDGGTDGVDTIIGRNAHSNWSVSSVAANSVSQSGGGTYITNFDRIDTLQGGSGNDAFTLNQANAFTGTLQGNAVDVTSGTDTLTISNGENTWNLRSAGGGDITGGATFERIEQLNGGGDNDTFIFHNTLAAFTSIHARGQTAPGFDTVDISRIENANAVFNGSTVYGVGGAEGIIGGLDDTLTGSSGGTNTWTINEEQGGQLVNGATLNFNGFGTLAGTATSTDNFIIDTDGIFSGAINGGTDTNLANNTLSNNRTNNAWVLTTNTSGRLTVENQTTITTFSNIRSIQGSATDSLTGIANRENDWQITAGNRGTLREQDNTADAVTLFEGMQNLWGNNSVDNFTFTVNGFVTGEIRGSAATIADTSADSILFASGASEIVSWNTSGINQGAITPGASGRSTFNYISIENLTGGAGLDTFNINHALTGNIEGLGALDTFNINAAVTGNLTGGAGSDIFDIGLLGSVISENGIIGGDGDTDILRGRDADSRWNITGTNEGSVQNSAQVDYVSRYSGIESLEGSNAGSDRFIFANNTASATSISAGDGQTDIMDYTAWNADLTVSANATSVNGATGIERVIGNNEGVDAGDFNSTLDIDNSNENTWIISDVNRGSVSDTGTLNLAFENVNNLTGGENTDRFNINGATAAITGQIHGAGGNADEINMQRGIAVEWNVTDNAQGNFSYGAGPTNTSFISVEELTGHQGFVDTFNIASTTTLITIDGADGIDGINDIIDFSAITENLVINLNNATWGNVTANNIERIVANDTDNNNQITGFNNVTNTWDINGINAGEISSTADTIEFSGFETIIGGNANDNFNFQSAGVIETRVSGGVAGGTNTLTGRNTDSSWSISSTANNTLTDDASGTLYVANFDAIDVLQGGSENDAFRLATVSSFTGIINGGTDGTTTNDIGDSLSVVSGSNTWLLGSSSAGWVDTTGEVNGPAFNQMETLIGGSGDDIFQFLSATLFGRGINAGDSNIDEVSGDTVDVSTLANYSVNITETNVNGVNNAENVLGNASSNTTLVGLNTGTNTWSIDAENSGSYANGETVINFDEVNSLTGGDSTDNFTLADGASINTIQAGDGDNTLTVLSDSGTTNWTINNINSGFVSGRVDSFQEVDNITGGVARDVFTFTVSELTSGLITGLIDGGELPDGIYDPDTHDEHDSATVDNVRDRVDVSAFTDGIVVEVGTVTEGFNPAQEYDASAPSTNIHVTNIEDIEAADLDAAGEINNWIALNWAQSISVEWDMDVNGEQNRGDIYRVLDTSNPKDSRVNNTNVGFRRFGSIIGSDGQYSSDIEPADLPDVAGNISGNVYYGSGGGSLNYTGSEFSGRFILVDLFDAIDSVHGRTDNDVVLRIRDEAGYEYLNGTNTWTITDIDSGSFNYETGTDETVIEFTNANHLMGGTGQDVFNFTEAGRITGSINGGGSTLDNPDTINASLIDSGVTFGLNERELVTIDTHGRAPGLARESAAWVVASREGVTDLFNIRELTLNPSDALVNTVQSGDSDSYVWDIDSAVAQNQLTVNGNILNFTGADVIQGGEGSDTFNIADFDTVRAAIYAGAGAGIDAINLIRLADGLTANVVADIETVTTPISAGHIFVADMENIQATGSNNTLVANGIQDNTWDITDTDGGTLNGGTENDMLFSGFSHLTGASSADTFTFTGNDHITGLIDGGSGNETTEDRIILTGADGDKIVQITNSIDNINNNLNIVNIERLNANAGFENELIASNAANIWAIDNTDSGSLSPTGSPRQDQILIFTDFENLTGGTADDTFNFGIDGTVAGLINAGLSGVDTLNIRDINNSQRVSLDEHITENIDIRAINLTHVFADSVDGEVNTLLANDDGDNIWNIDNENSGTLNFGDASRVQRFEGFANLIGADAASDAFTIVLGGNVTGVIDGGTNLAALSNDTLDISSYTAGVIVELVDDGTSTTNNIHVANVEQITAAPGDGIDNRLINARSGNYDWTVRADNTGSLQPTSNVLAENTVTFIHFGSLEGGAGNDNFAFEVTGNLSGGIDGGDGIDRLNLSNSTTDLDFTLGTAIDLAVAGTSIAGLEGLIGNNDGSSASAPSATLRIIDGDATWRFEDTDEIINGIEVDGINDGTLDDGIGGIPTISFINFDRVVGGAGVDNFIFTGAARITGHIDGGDAGSNTINAGTSTVNLTVQLGEDIYDVINVQNITEIHLGTDPSLSNSLIATDSPNTWNITRNNSGVLNNTIDFSGVANLTGGAGQDIFNVGRVNSYVTGLIDGGAGDTDTADIINVAAGRDLIVEVGNNPSDNFNIINIETLNADNGNNNQLIADDTANIWQITDTNNGTLAPASGATADNTLTFFGVANLTGGTANDNFILDGADSITGNIDGGMGTTPETDTSMDTLNLTSLGRDISVVVGEMVDGDLNIVNFEQLHGNTDTTNTLTGDDLINNWQINDTDGGSLNTMAFTEFANLEGGNSNDTFNFLNTGNITGYIDGNDQTTEGQDILNLSQLSSVDIRLGDGLTGIRDIERIIGNGQRSSSITADNIANIWTIDEANGGTINSVISFSDFGILNGGNVFDEFNITGNFNGEINAGDGNDTIRISDGGTVSGLINAGAGNDDLFIDILQGTEAAIYFDGGEGTNTIRTILQIPNGDAPINYVSAVYTPVSDEGRQELAYTTDADMTYSVYFNDIARVTDLVEADLLDIQTTSVADVVTLSDNQFNVSTEMITYSTVDFDNKDNVRILAADNDQINLEGIININSTLTLRGGTVSAVSAEAFINASEIIFEQNANVGTAENRIQLDVDTAQIINNTQALYIEEASDIELTGIGSSQLIDILAEGDIHSSANLNTTGEFVATSNNGNLSLLGADNRLVGQLSLIAGGDGQNPVTGLVQFNNDNASILNNISARQLEINSTGAISSNEDGAIIVYGETYLDASDGAGSQNISLVSSANDFMGSINITNADTVTLVDSNGVNINQANINNLTLTSLSETSRLSGIVAMGAVNIDAVNIDIVNGVVANGIQAGQIDIVASGLLAQNGGLMASGEDPADGHAIQITANEYTSSVGEQVFTRTEQGSISLTVTNNITTQLLDSASHLEVNSINGSIILGQALDVGGTLGITAGNAINLSENIMVQDDVALTSGTGDISQNANIQSVTGSVNIISGGGITMSSGATTTVAGTAINYSAENDINLSILNAGRQNEITTELSRVVIDSTAGEINAIAGDVAVTADFLQMDAQRGMGMNSVLNTNVNIVSGGSQTGEINLNNTQEIVVERLHNNGNITLSVNEGDIVVGLENNFPYTTGIYTEGDPGSMDANIGAGRINANYAVGQVILSTTSGGIRFDGTAGTENPDIIAREAFMNSPAGQFGQYGRWMYLYVQDYLEIRSILSNFYLWGFGIAPQDWKDFSPAQRSLSDILNTAADQLVDVETLDEVDPAVFTNVRNYFYDDVSIKLPRDQLFDDELDEEEGQEF